MRLPTDEDLIRWQQQLERFLAHFTDTDLRQATDRISDPAVHDAAAVYVTRPSKRLLGMAFLYMAHVLDHPDDVHHDHLTAIAAALEIRHGAILAHDDIVDGDTIRGGQPTAHHALVPAFGEDDARSAALFAGDVLAGLAPLPILRSTLPAPTRVRLSELFQHTTALVAAGQTEQLHLDVRQDPGRVTEADILRIHAGQFAPYLLCSLHLAGALAGLDDAALDRITDACVPLCQSFQVQNDVAGFRELARLQAQGDQTGPALTLANTSDLARRRRTALVRAALDRLPSDQRARLLTYLGGGDDNLTAIVDLVQQSKAADSCAGLILELQAQTRERITADPHLSVSFRTALQATVRYMTALYDPSTPESRLYLEARPDLAPAA
ncbi:polyprenyl synthetase family protein [Streptomyces sp. NPDC021218]|uniref:polyprenyl synthetase family protein n=1 Tax=Streptomyces sp. NPDC021218 TaxID=3365119 RepID=UPI00379B2A10